MKGIEGQQQQQDIIDAIRAVVSRQRPAYDAAIQEAAQHWRRQLVEEVGARLIDERAMTMIQMSDTFKRIELALDDLRLDIDPVVHLDGHCHEFPAGSVRL